MIKYFEAFAGIGAFRSAFEKVGGFECVGWCEIDRFAQKAYRTLYDTKGEIFYEDITKIDYGSMPDFDLLVGGPCCQSFSVAGRRLAFEDDRGNLFFNYIQILEAKRPRYFIAENVPNLLGISQGECFRILLEKISELGYSMCWRVLNSAGFGIPQSRRRLFLVGYLGDRCPSEIEKEFMAFDNEKKHLYTEEMLQNICLGLHSMCKGAESKYFNGKTNIRDGEFICFGVKGLMDTNKRLKDTLLFNILSYMSNQLLGLGNTVAAVDELYLFLTNMTAIEYIRNGMKRVRKKESSFILASQNIEDFLLPEIKEFTKPLFSIPSHHFLFNPGNISPTAFIDTLQLEESEYSLIKYPERGTCLYRCGNERYLLQVIAPAYKAALFGSAGGR